MPRTFRCLAALAWTFTAGLAHAQATTPAQPPRRSTLEESAEYVRAHYTKYEYRIPMRDGVKLFTSVYVPNDASPTQRYPLQLLRTPYTVSPYGLERYKRQLGGLPFEKEGFIFVFQDVRGQHMSEGEFVNMRPHVPK
jgi:hypothetical protein